MIFQLFADSSEDMHVTVLHANAAQQARSHAFFLSAKPMA